MILPTLFQCLRSQILIIQLEFGRITIIVEHLRYELDLGLGDLGQI